MISDGGGIHNKYNQPPDDTPIFPVVKACSLCVRLWAELYGSQNFSVRALLALAR